MGIKNGISRENINEINMITFLTVICIYRNITLQDTK